MSRLAFAALLLATLTGVASAEEARKFHVNYPAPEAPQERELSIEANYWLWLPENLEGRPVRGIIVHQHGCGEGAELGGVTAADDLHWQALARKHDCALMGSSYRAKGAACGTWCDPRNGSDEAFRNALSHFAKETGRPEIAQVGWCLWGHSGGGTWASWMMTLHPERLVAAWLRSGTAYGQWKESETSVVLGIPVVCNPGVKEKGHERFDGAWTGGLAMFEGLRAKGAPIAFAPDPLRSHECGDSRYVAIPFFDACLEMRLPPADAALEDLRPVTEEGVWLGDWVNATAKPLAETTSDPAKSSWLPSEHVAEVWKEYVGTGMVGDVTPPPAPTDVSIVRNPDGTVILKWNQVADFESGIGGFEILADGETVGTLPEKPDDRFGRPLFQRMSYHDTPEAPVPALEFVIPAAKVGEAGAVTVVAKNAVGLETPCEQPVEIPKAP